MTIPDLRVSFLTRFATFNLQFFWQHENNPAGSIPPCMANMASLVEVNFASNDFTGTIPAFGTNNPNLVNLLLMIINYQDHCLLH